LAKFYTNDNVALDYNVYGEGPAIILIAGYSGNQSTWTAQITPLLEAGLKVITYDRRNHGLSQSVDYGMRISRHGQDLFELISKLKIKKPILLGHSMGASTIFSYLSLYGDSNIQAIITEDQSPKTLKDNDWPYGVFDSDLSNLDTAIYKITHTKLTKLKLSEKIKSVISANYKVFNFQYNQPLLFDSLIQDWTDIVSLERVEHLFIAGGQSPLWPIGYNDAIARLAKYGSAITINEAGHIPHLEAPDEFNREIINFIKSVV
jgi:pimeloyl-ACP methyl ester carboxylesterase